VASPLSRVLQIPGENVRPDNANVSIIASTLRDGRDLLHKAAILRKRDGNERSVNFSVFPLRDRDKVVGGVIVIQFPDKTGE
jgi:hypothetical protein